MNVYVVPAPTHARMLVGIQCCVSCSHVYGWAFVITPNKHARVIVLNHWHPKTILHYKHPHNTHTHQQLDPLELLGNYHGNCMREQSIADFTEFVEGGGPPPESLGGAGTDKEHKVRRRWWR